MLQLFKAGKENDLMISRTRGYLRHLLSPNGTYFLTFRLDDSLPAKLLIRWKNELQLAKSLQKDPKSIKELDQAYFSKIEKYLDTNYGSCWLKNPRIASLVVSALRYYHGQRYDLQSWTIMPNHVHGLYSVSEYTRLGSILQDWKSFTAHQANKLLCRSGRF